MKNYWVYILICSDRSYYTGVTNDIERRYLEHKDGRIPKCYTHNRRPVKLVYSCEFVNINDAIAFEMQIKGRGRKKKKALIDNDINELKRLSRGLL